MLIDIPEFFPLAVGLSIALVAYRLSALIKAKARKLNAEAEDREWNNKYIAKNNPPV